MNEKERQELAERLAELSYKKARSEIRKLDPDANLKYWRNAIGAEWHTAYELPNKGVKISLLEKPEHEPIYQSSLVTAKPIYVEARVEPLEH
jgi:hypothetical protein